MLFDGWFLMKYVVAIIVLLLFPLSLQGATFSVDTVPELETALATAEGNGEDDTIYLASGVYNLSGTLGYDSHEDRGISLQGVGGEVTIDGGGNRVLFMRTYTSNGFITLNGIVFTNGYAQEGDNGAGIFINISSGDLTIENCQITDNFAAAFYFTNHGGGAYITAGINSDVVIRNCVVAGNSAKGQGGGMYLSLIGGTLFFVNNTIVDNHNKTGVVEGGGGIYLRLYFDSATAHFYNNILWGNTYSSSNGDLYIENDGDNSGGAATVHMYNNDYNQLDYNLAGNLTLLDNISQDPLLSTDFHLDPSSPCLDVGHAAAPGLSTQDFEGDPRPMDGNCDGNGGPDMGADEYYSPLTVTTTPPTDVTSAGASGGGSIIDTGGRGVSDRGVCWSTEVEPTLLDGCTVDGAGAGSFVSSLTGLSPYTTYYVRAYASNCEGTTYGNELSFNTGGKSLLPILVPLLLND
jgi:hypothetical protein